MDIFSQRWIILRNKKSGAEGTRTLYLIAASDALSQVSYDPV